MREREGYFQAFHIWFWEIKRYQSAGYSINQYGFVVFGRSFRTPSSLLRPRAVRYVYCD